ncbi:ABC transporter substrate-binding protein [Defluviitalea phaphyphila]|uniref:ABC transporter substrate-binding protein n=1 Tax=Defluviitalea phaphyphila TaxID=1473580 RepID=UPI000731D85A|nr:ABC transporter substrate-binding protein [Defluviitalea phaphyphila]
MKKILIFMITIICLITITGCQKKELDYSIRFGLLPAESAIPIIVAKEQGFYEEEGVDVELISFNSPNDRNVAVQAGEIDAIIADIMTSLTFHEAGFDMKITSDINEDFKLLTSPNSGIENFQELNGKSVSIVPNFVLEYIMDEMARENNIEYETVVIPSFTARFEALLADQIHGVIFTEPQASLLVSQGANLLASSKEYDIKAGTLLFDNKILQEHPDEVKAFYKAYNKAIEYINTTDSDEYSEKLSEYGFPEAIKDYLKSGIEYTKAQKITQESFDSVLEWTKSKGLIENSYTFEEVSDFSYIE